MRLVRQRSFATNLSLGEFWRFLVSSGPVVGGCYLERRGDRRYVRIGTRGYSYESVLGLPLRPWNHRRGDRRRRLTLVRLRGVAVPPSFYLTQPRRLLSDATPTGPVVKPVGVRVDRPPRVDPEEAEGAL